MPRSGVGSAARSRSRRLSSDPDPMHEGRYHPLEPFDGKGGVNICGPYEPVLDWPRPIDPSWRPGSARGVYVESPDRVVAVHGGEVPAYTDRGVWGVKVYRNLEFAITKSPRGRHRNEIIVYSRDGSPVEVWDHWLDAMHANDLADGRPLNLGHVNRIRVDPGDPDRHIWIVGTRNTGIFKITNDGRTLALQLDANLVPPENHPLYYVQDVAFLPDGDLIVAHWHSLMRFAADGSYVLSMGSPGSGRGQFDGLHDVVVHPETSLMYLNDRLNRRVVVMDPDGDVVDEWPRVQGCSSLRLTADGQHLWAGNGLMHKFVKYELSGRLVPEATWGTFGIAPGAFWSPHYFDTDSEGSLYIAEDYHGRLQKLRLRPDAAPDDPQVIGPLSR